MSDESADYGPFASRYWIQAVHEQAYENVQKWGEQNTETLLLAMQEELGELTQAHLEYNWEDGDDYRVPAELIDLAALLVQLHWKITGASVVDTDAA